MIKFLKRNNFLFLFVGILIFASCEDSKSPLSKYGSFFEHVMRSENGVFRGFNLGVQIDSVLENEQAKAVEADENYLYYEFQQDTTGSYNVAYTFNEKGLAEIQSDLFITNQANTDSIFNCFKSYFDEHYGPSETDMGYSVWSIKSDLFGDVKINLSNESSDFSVPNSPGKVSIWIYPDKQ